MSARGLSVATVLCVVACARTAGADEEAPADSRPPSWVHPALAAVGTYRRLFDLDLWGGGAAASLNFEGRRAVGVIALQVTDSRTPGGLVFMNGELKGGADWMFDSFRFGLGGGVTLNSIRRATDGSWISTLGPLLMIHAAYDFSARRPCFFLEVEFETSTVGSGESLIGMSGVSLQMGARF
jgi:hypothetical protein